MRLHKRPFRADDYQGIRKFLSQNLLLNRTIQKSWHVSRWDYWRWHVLENITHANLEKVIRLWETPSGKLTAVLHPEGDGEAFFEINPEVVSKELIEEMVIEAEASLSTKTLSGLCTLTIWTIHEDALREQVLHEKGYVRSEPAEYLRWRDITGPVAPFPLAPGYTIRSLGDIAELPARSWASWKAFHPDEPDEAYQGWEWYPNVQKADGYRQDMDLVAVSQEGEIAGFCTVWLDPVTQTGMFEPVGVVPHHKQKGLGKALMNEGLTRLARLGARRAFVGSYGPIAHALYESAGFTNYILSVPWTREFDCYEELT
jgi:GNAT superfamily N-acetyltransferase